MLHVIFDRSAFHGSRFDELEASALRKLIHRNQFSVIHTPILIEETLSGFASQRITSWQKHLRFMMDICNGGIFLDKENIWHNELVSGYGVRAKYLLPNKSNRRTRSRGDLEARLRDIANSGDLSQEWIASQSMRDDARKKKANQKVVAVSVRSEIAEKLKEGQFSGSLKSLSFSTFLNSEFVWMGRRLVGIIDMKRAVDLQCQWTAAPGKYPFFSSFVEGVIYAGFYAAVKHNEPIDANAQADYEQLCYLNWADIVVSDDTKFFQSAFNGIWCHRGKRLLTSTEFISLCECLS